jgi:hypothetical protein
VTRHDASPCHPTIPLPATVTAVSGSARRDGRACYQVELGAAELDWLVKLNWLTEAETCDRAAVVAARR